MVLRAILILGMLALAAGVWWAAWTIVRTNSRAKREWHRITGTITSVANPLRPIVKVEKGIEFTAPLVQTDGPSPYAPDERVLEMESDEGLRWGFDRVEFLIDPVAKRARVAGGVGFSPFLLALLGVVYLGLAGGFYLVTNPSPPQPGKWTYYQAPPWTEPALVSARLGAWSWLQHLLGAAILVFGLVMVWRSGGSSLAVRAGYGSVALFVVGVLSVYALDKATYRIEADSTGLRECSAIAWKITPWQTLRGAVDETIYYSARRSARSQPMLDHVTRRVYFTDDQQREVISIGDNLNPEQARALLDYVLSRTNLQPEKQQRNKELFNYRQ